MYLHILAMVTVFYNSSDLGIEFGGVDIEGTIDPAAPELPDLDSYFD